MTHSDDSPGDQRDLHLRLGHDELIIRRRYETLSIANDFFIALWFLLGSVFFLRPSLQTTAIWLFIAGSAQFIIRPGLRLAHQIHLGRIPESRWDM